jgi:hypothetical protein
VALAMALAPATGGDDGSVSTSNAVSCC